MNAVVNASHLAIGLFALWFLYFFCWREHRVDTFRQRLFSVRDELFDYAASGAIRFDDPAYTTLRDLSNRLIRFAHRLTFVRVQAIVLFGNLSSTNRMDAWMEDVKSRTPEVRNKLLKAHEQIGNASLGHVVAWSPLAWAFILAGVLLRLLKLRVAVRVVREPKDISKLLEQEALDQSALVDDDECLLAV